MREFHRPHHRTIVYILGSLDAHFLLESGCFFGGGTRLALMLGEYRESRDIDFLCSDRSGFRRIRETIDNTSLGAVLRRPIQLAREVRSDRDGVRTVLDVEGARIKFAIILEGRLDLTGDMDPDLCVPVLSLECAAAEKLLANADRGLDRSTVARDLIDLAFLAASVSPRILEEGARLAEMAYGTAMRHHLALTLDAFRGERVWANRCIASLAIEDTKTLRKGIGRLGKLLA